MNKLASSETPKRKSIYDMLLDQIITHKLEPGTVFVERQICEMLNISRTPVREALRQLVSEGFIQNLPSSGFMVSEATVEKFLNLNDVREFLDALACRLCAQHITPSELETLRAVYAKLNKAIEDNDVEAQCEADHEFHLAVISYSHNNYLINLCSSLYQHVKRFTQKYILEHNPTNIVKASHFHRDIIEAIEARDADKAEKIMRKHTRALRSKHIRLFTA